jgi:hypothetical protein
MHTVPFFNLYTITDEGEIWSDASNWRGYGRRRMTAHLNDKGYLRVRLTIMGKRRSYFVHKLVAAAFLPSKPSPQHEVRHLDGDPLNNAASNLAWGTRKDNAADRERHGRTSRGPSHSAAIRSGLAAR